MYTIKLADGTKLTGLEVNGNNFIAHAEFDTRIFNHNLSHVEITSDNLPNYEDFDPDSETPDLSKYDEPSPCGVFENMELAYLKKQKDGSIWFVLLEIDPSKLERMKMNAKLEYLAMMSDIDIDVIDN